MSAQKKDNNYRFLGVDENGNEKLFKHKDKLKKAGYKFVKKILVEKEEKKKTVEKPKVIKTINYYSTPLETSTLNPTPSFVSGLDSHAQVKPDIPKDRPGFKRMRVTPTVKVDEDGTPHLGLNFVKNTPN